MAWKPNTRTNNTWNQYMTTLRSKPGAYESSWQSQLDNLYGQISNRGAFKYDVNADALYQQYKDSFTMQGKQASQDAMGKASAATGGFGNSFAQQAAQGAYQGYMNQLAQTIPGLENQAYGRWQDQGQDLLNLYNITMDNETNAYGRYRDQVGDWQTNRDFNYGLYADQRAFDYGAWSDQRDFDYNKWNQNRFYNLGR